MDWSGPRHENVVGSCKYGNEPSTFTDMERKGSSLHSQDPGMLWTGVRFLTRQEIFSLYQLRYGFWDYSTGLTHEIQPSVMQN